jgi:uncharacterized repeat protein (TIGR01451 family)
LGAIALAVITAPAGFAAVLTHVDVPAGAGGPTGAVLPTPTEGTVVICDQMAMIPAGTYTAGNGNAMAGGAPFGMTADLQAADDCTLAQDLQITEACVGTLTFLGLPPSQGIWIQVYADAGGGVPANTFSFDQVVPPADVTSTPFVDTVFGLLGRILCADVAPGLIVPAGTWFFDIQPIGTAPTDDWYFIPRTANGAPVGADSFGKDGGAEHGPAFGGPYPGGYGTATWLSMAALGFGAGDSAISLMGEEPIMDADLSVTKVADVSSAAPGDPITYTITVSNAGPDDAPQTVVADMFPAGLINVTWTCMATAGSTCTAMGMGDINDLADILAGGSVTYTVMATVDPNFSGSISNTVTITPGPNVVDPTPGDQTSTADVGVIQNPLEIPTLGQLGIALLALGLAVAALIALRRRTG